MGSGPANNNNNNNTWDTAVVLPVKYLSYFWRSLNLTLTNCEIELDLL